MMKPETDAAPGIDESGFLDGRLRLRQFKRGHRAGTDAIILAMAGPAGFEGLCLDLGAGTGAAGLAYAELEPGARVVLVEIEPALAALARENIAINSLTERVQVREADIMSGLRADGGHKADLILTNPPYLDQATIRASPDPLRQRAHIMPEGGLTAWAGAAAGQMAHHGLLIMVQRADQTGAVLSALTPAFGSIALLPVHPRANALASRILVRAVKGSKGRPSILPALILHDADGGFSARAQAIQRGRERIAWDG